MMSVNVRVRRVGLGLTQAELAESLGVGQSLVAMWEGGERVPTEAQEGRLRAFFLERAVESRDRERLAAHGRLGWRVPSSAEARGPGHRRLVGREG